MLALVLALLFQGQTPQESAPTVDAVTIEALRKAPPVTLPDQEIVGQLNALLEAEPDRIICVKQQYSNSLIRRNVCNSLRGWYDMEARRDTNNTVAMILGDEARNVPARPGPPDELVKLIKDRIRNRETRALAAVRADERRAAQAAATPTSTSTN